MIDTAQSFGRTHTRKITKIFRPAFNILTFFVSANIQGSDETATLESLLTKTQSIEGDEDSCQAPRLFFHDQLSMLFIMLIIVQMPTIVGILTIISIGEFESNKF